MVMVRIGVVMVDLFFKFMFFGIVGVRFIDFSLWFNWDSWIWFFGLLVSWNVFDMGCIWFNIEL